MRKLVEIYFKGRNAPVVVDFEGEWPTELDGEHELLEALSTQSSSRRLRAINWESILAIVEVPVITDGQEVWTSPEGEEFPGPRETV